MPVLRGLLALCLLGAWGAAALAQVQAQGTPGPGEQDAVTRTIRAQMEAFKRDDGVEAFSYAAPAIREIFQTPDVFMQMVRGGYAPVYRPREVEFLEPRAEGGEILQPVRVTGPDGESVIALYRMQRQADGTWKIAGVVLLRTGEFAS